MARLAENTKLAAVVLAAALSASAATRTWNGGGDGSTWADARNWGGTAGVTGTTHLPLLGTTSGILDVHGDGTGTVLIMK